ncbi:hypothetical protein LTR84_006564 [Exophiala bonariae]|uniref:Wax synthase domain-containing protein n=1 Tax=Exophiala bonariae TaxID=1690606 RepID=A0AAV9N3J2_9EURO|nr:hypothetical protein LTR84_006564 [Exophiala bonariae]
MSLHWIESIDILINKYLEPTLRPELHPIPGTQPLSFIAAILPPTIYYFALLLLAPAPPPCVDSLPAKIARNTLAVVACVLFIRLSLCYHVPQSIGLTYQLGLVSLYGACRVVDAFFISPYLFGHIPRRVQYQHRARPETRDDGPHSALRDWTDGGVTDPFTFERKSRISHGAVVLEDTSSSATRHGSNDDSKHDMGSAAPIPRGRALSFEMLRRSISGPDPQPVYEIATTERGWPRTISDRAAWALELELSMRGVGFTWTTADVRHTRKTWLPGVANRIHSILVHVLPVLLVSWVTIKSVYTRFLLNPEGNSLDASADLFDTRLPIHVQLYLTAALGAFLMSAFSLGHSLFAIMLSPLAPSPLAFFPPLYTTRIWKITSVRQFWSFGWHRLFARLFLVYGVWPGQWVERKLTGKKESEPADIGKVLGGFLSSAFVHSYSVRGVLGGKWSDALGEAHFFALNGLAVIAEEVVIRYVRSWRRRHAKPYSMWYDPWIGRIWWTGIVLWTGRNFARGWVKASLVREMAFM